MNPICFFIKLIKISWHLISGVIEISLIFPFLSLTKRNQRIQIWAQKIVKIFAINTKINGNIDFSTMKGQIIVANHISWIDVFVINALIPTRFIAKSEVAKWPIIGYLASKANTIFVSRQRSNGTQAKINTVLEALAQGENITFFPEGTTGKGDTLLPFKNSFFQTAIDTNQKIFPVLCRYPDEEGKLNPKMEYCGDTSLWQSICSIASQKTCQAELYFLDPVEVLDQDRRALSQQVYNQMALALQKINTENLAKQ